MNTPLAFAPSTAAPRPLRSFFADASRVLCAFAAAIDAWLERRRRAANDAAALTGMSDRDLKDIGIDRGFVQSVADGSWVRDPPY